MRYALLLLLSGCAWAPFDHTTPTDDMRHIKPYPLEIEYELLQRVTGSVCADGDAFKLLSDSKSVDVNAIGNAGLYEQAKWLALSKIEDADGIVGIRAQVTRTPGGECVRVTGRAYRIKSMRATPPYKAEPSSDGTLAPDMKQ